MFASRLKLKNTLIFIILAAGAVATGWLAIEYVVSRPGFKTKIENAASNFLKSPLTIESLEWRRWPRGVLIAQNVKMWEDENKRQLLASSPSIEAHITLLSVLRLAAGVSDMKFITPDIYLRRDKKGRWNILNILDRINNNPNEKSPKKKWGQVLFNWFTIEKGHLHVQRAESGDAILPVMIAEGRGKLRFGQRGPTFPYDLVLRFPEEKTSIFFDGRIGRRLRLEIKWDNASLSHAALAWPQAAGWKGISNGSLSYRSKEPSWEFSTDVSNLSFSSGTTTIHAFKAQGRIKPNSESVFDVLAKSSTTEIAVKGRMTPRDISLDVKSPKTDLAELWTWSQAVAAADLWQSGQFTTTTPVPSTPRTFKASIEANAARFRTATFEHFEAKVHRDSGSYIVDGATFEGLGGSITAKAAISTETINVTWQTRGVRALDLFKFAGSDMKVSGILDSDGRLQTTPSQDPLRTLNGDVTMRLKDGWLEGMPGLLKILGRLNLTTLFTEIKGEHQSRIPFKETEGSFRIENGRASTQKPITLENKTTQMAFMGSYDFRTKQVDGKIVVNFLTVADEVIGKIPGVRDIILGDEKGFIPLWIAVKGNAADPKIDVLSTRSIAAPVWNTVSNVLRLPKKIFDKIRGK